VAAVIARWIKNLNVKMETSHSGSTVSSSADAAAATAAPLESTAAG